MVQALNIPTKINKGTVEISADVQLIVQGEKVGASEATLLAKLGIKPFSYGLVIRQVSTIFRPLTLRPTSIHSANNLPDNPRIVAALHVFDPAEPLLCCCCVPQRP